MSQKYKFYYPATSGFSIYAEMARQLLATGLWAAESKIEKLRDCRLILGDRFDIPYHLLRSDTRGFKRVVNYFRGSHKLTLKASMARLLRDVPGSAAWSPATFVLGGKQDATDERELLRQYMEEGAGNVVMIVKPSAGCKGVGISLSRSFEEIVSSVDEIRAHVTGSVAPLFAVQKYIERPLLYNGRKFDIRVWCLLTHPFTIYQFSEGSCRLTSEAYSLTDDLSSTYAHLTNHDLQKSSPNFGQFEKGNEMWFSDLDVYLAAHHPGVTVDTHFKPQFGRIITDTLLSIKELIEVDDRENFQCFQLFGFDFIIDEAMQVHLLEINGSPGSAEKWLEPMVASIISLAVAPVHSPVPEVAEAADTAEAAAKGGETSPCWERVYHEGQK